MITAVLMSRRRYDLLEESLTSFLRTNPAPLERLIVVEDGPDIPRDVRDRFPGRSIEWISTGRRVGYVAAVDYSYSRVKSPFVFHMETDWRFHRPGYLERSLRVLRANPKCLQVRIQALDDLGGHPLEEHAYTNDGVAWRKLALDQQDEEGPRPGFSFDPGLRRLSDYVAVGGYAIHAVNTRLDPDNLKHSERAVGELYRTRDFFAAVLSDEHGSGYVRRIGDGHGVRHAGDSNP
jgi:hypothetical protein